MGETARGTDRTQGAAAPWTAASILLAPDTLVALVAFALHTALRNFAASDLNTPLPMLDLGWQLDVAERLLHGGQLPRDLPLPYGPVWAAYVVGCFRVFGLSIAATRWGIVVAAWVRTFGTYVLASRIVGRRWALVAVAVTFVSPAVLEPRPYAGHLVSALFVVLAGVTVFAARHEAPRRSWFWPGLIAGTLLGVRALSGLLGVAAVVVAGAASGRLHPPGRHGHWVGTLAVPAGLVAFAVPLLHARPPAFWAAFGAPVAACAVLALVESWRQRTRGPDRWSEWGAFLGWGLAGFAAAVLPWFVPLAAAHGPVGAAADVCLGPFRGGALDRMLAVAAAREAGAMVPPLPSWPLLAVLGGLGFAMLLSLRPPAEQEWWFLAGLLGAAGLLLAVAGVRVGAHGAWLWARVAQLWLAAGGFTGWALVRAVRGWDRLRPPWLVPLACVAAVCWLDAAAGDRLSENWAIAPGLILATAGARALWHLPGRRYLRAPVALVVLVAVAARTLPVARLWVDLLPYTWEMTPRRLVWLNLERAQVWDGAASARELTATATYLAGTVPEAGAVFEFPAGLGRFLAARPAYGQAHYFLPTVSEPGLDARVAARLRRTPPAAVVLRDDPRTNELNIGRLQQAYPQILHAIDEDFVLVRRSVVTAFYVPRAQASAPERPAGE